jgi:hypothetical protein
MKGFRFLWLAVFALAALALAADKVGLEDLAKDPKTYDGKTVETTGTVAEFKQRTSRAGNKYFTFQLKAGEKTVNVYSRGEAGSELKDGVKAKVVGVFRQEKKVQDFVVKNEIDASKVKDKENGVHVLKS